LFFNLLQRDLRSRFIGSFSGWLWLLVNPLLLLGVYALVFGVIFRARAPEGLDVPFIAWLAVGLWPWLAFSDAIQRASESIPQHAALISKVSIRREFLTLSAGLSAALLQFAGYAFVLLAIALLGTKITLAGLAAAIVTLVTTTVLAAALGLVASALRVFVRDVQHLLPTLLMLWFFSTPILYAPDLIPEPYRDFIWLNPLAGLVGDLRAALFEGQLLPGTTTLVMLPLSLVLLWLAHRFYRRLSPHFEDFM